jgi:flavin-dependent dehydrogenase
LFAWFSSSLSLEMSDAKYDAIVIGGGPGGATTATFLARRGRRVLVLEKEHFPRFHIGESLLPYNRAIFEEMGFLPILEKAGLIKKTGAQFHIGNGCKSLYLVFRNGRFTREPAAFQVERATFDHMLLKYAEQCGATVREGWTVSRYASDDNGATVEARSDSGEQQTFRAAFLVDASGRGNLTGNQEGLREIHPNLKKLAVFGHFADVRLDGGEKAGDTVIVRLENKWFWIIPLSAEKTSVGCVMDQQEFQSELRNAKSDARTPDFEARVADFFARIWQASPPLRERMQGARLLGAMHVTSDFSYRNRTYVGKRLLRVGDAAGFMDPIFSAGVYLACYSAKMAAHVIDDALHRGTDGAPALRRYDRKIYRAMQIYWEMVEGFYTTRFMEVFMSPRHRFSLPAAVTAVLAGELEGGWKVRWRMRVFFWIVKLQRKFPLLPRISFAPTHERAIIEVGEPALNSSR